MLGKDSPWVFDPEDHQCSLCGARLEKKSMVCPKCGTRFAHSSSGYDGWRDSSSTPWFHQGMTQVTITNAYTEYRYRTRTTSQQTTYGEWSEWSDAVVEGSDTLDVETRTVYRTKVYH